MSSRSLFDQTSSATAAVGGVITDVAALPSNPNLKRIKVDAKLVARLATSDIEALKIEVGRKWTAALAARVVDAMNAAKARRDAMTMLGRRALSRGELIDRLVRRGHSQPIANRVAGDLQEHHWIDDESYATALAQELLLRKGASHAMIVERLVKRRIDEALARNVAKRILGEVDPVEAAVELARKRLATMNNIAPQRAAGRIASFLARRGFDEETVADAIDRIGLTER